MRWRRPRWSAERVSPSGPTLLGVALVVLGGLLGIPGLVLLGWLAVVTLGGLLAGAHRSTAGRTALVVGLTLGAIAVHSLFYNAFFEDPATWALLGLGALALARRREERAEARA